MRLSVYRSMLGRCEDLDADRMPDTFEYLPCRSSRTLLASTPGATDTTTNTSINCLGLVLGETVRERPHFQLNATAVLQHIPVAEGAFRGDLARLPLPRLQFVKREGANEKATNIHVDSYRLLGAYEVPGTCFTYLWLV